MKQKNENIIVGRNPVMEALNSNRNIEYILINKGISSGALISIINKAKKMGVTIKNSDIKKLNNICENIPHQGVIAIVSENRYYSIDDIFETASLKNEPVFLIIADKIEDPYNLGAIIRTAVCSGAHGIIIPKRRSSGITHVVNKSSAGAVNYIKIAKVTNISDTIDDLKKRGIWVYGADMLGNLWCESNLNGPIALVIGNEGKGISRLIKEKCDGFLSLPMMGEIKSLNASVAAGVLMYEIARQRMNLNAK